MPKLQCIKRANGSLVYSINIPLNIINAMGLKKGDNLSVEISADSSLVVNKVV